MIWRVGKRIIVGGKMIDLEIYRSRNLEEEITKLGKFRVRSDYGNRSFGFRLIFWLVCRLG